jgi:hypothetical protein
MNMKSFQPLTSAILAVWWSPAFLALLVGGLLLSTSEAAVREFWRVRSSDISEAFRFNVAKSAVDTNGHLVVAGTLVSFGTKLFVASFDTNGVKQWEFIRPDGAVIVSFAEHGGQFYTTASLLCVDKGELRWERIEPNVAYGAGYRKLKVNEGGELFMYGFDWLEQPAVLNFPASVSKYDIAGHELWRTRQPFISISTAYLPMPFDLTAAGQPIVAGVAADSFPNALTCLNAVTGNVRWQRRPRGIFHCNVAVKAGPKSICVSGDDGYLVYANNGRRLATRRDHRYLSDRITTTREGGFLLLSPHGGNYQAVLSPSGRLRWNNFSEGFPAIGIFEDAVDGYVHFGMTGRSLVFRRLDRRGQSVSSEILGEYPITSWPPLGMKVLAAPDGTWRLVSNHGNYDFIIAAYGEEPDVLVQNEIVRPDKFIHFSP